MNIKFPAAVPEIPVNDLKKAAEYYETKLGFSIDWSFEPGGEREWLRERLNASLRDDR